jgi:6,7-dimethyl-8-ribityllumazine synthase
LIMPHILIVEARFYAEIADAQLAGALAALAAAGATYDRISVPGALEIPAAVSLVENEAQAWARARVSEKDKGGEAAKAALAMIGLKGRFD